MPINTMNVRKASDWSHAVLFNRPIGTSGEAEFLRVRQVVISSIFEQQESIDQSFEIPSTNTKPEPNFFEQGQYKATLSVFIEDQEEPFTSSFSFAIFPNTFKYWDRNPKTTNSKQVSCQIGHPTRQNIRGFSRRRLRNSKLISPIYL